MSDRLEEFGELFADFVRAPLAIQSSIEPEFRVLLREHLGADPQELPVVAESVPAWNHPNLQLGVEALLADLAGARLVGIAGGQKRFTALSLSDLVHERHFRPGSVEYENLAIGRDAGHPCILFGLALVEDAARRAVLLVRRGEPHGPTEGACRSRRCRPARATQPTCSRGSVPRCATGTSPAGR